MSIFKAGNNFSIESIVYILSTGFAPRLHQKSALRADRLAASLLTEDRSGLRPRRGQTGLSIPVVSEANIRSLYSRRERSDQ